MKSTRAASQFCALGLTLLLAALFTEPAGAVEFTWSDVPISGEAGVENPDFFPEGSAVFTISGNTLTITVNYTGSSEDITSVNQVLTGLTWELEGFTGTLDADSAVIAAGSSLVGVDASSWTGGDDLSGQWAYKDDIAATGLGSYGVGAIGDINDGEDSFGTADIIDPSKTFDPPAPNGIDYGIVGPGIDLSGNSNSFPDGFKKQGPVVQNSMEFTLTFTGELTESMITNVQPIFGSEGMPLTRRVPEPATVLLMGIGLASLLVLSNLRRGRRSSNGSAGN